MSALRPGDTGDDVRWVQKVLRAGLAADGIFGPATQQAVKAFQAEHGLAADGVVGPLTWAKLHEQAPVHAYYGHLADQAIELALAMFPKGYAASVRENAPLVFQALDRLGMADPLMQLYTFATIYAETGDFRPKSEGVSRFNTAPGGKPFAKYDHRSDIGNLGPPDGQVFRGRGYIQLTGRANYRVFGGKIGVDLEESAEKANNPAIAAAVTAHYLKSKEGRIRNALKKGRRDTARRAVNGGVNGLKDFTRAYDLGEKFLRSKGM